MMDVHHAKATNARLDYAMQHCAPHLYPVLLAVRDWPVGLLFVSQKSGRFSVPTDSGMRRAAVLLVGDDTTRSLGPNGFHTASLFAAIRNTDAFVIVAGAPSDEIYAAGAAVAVGGKNAMIVETRPRHEADWTDLIGKLAPGRPILLSTVKGGTA